MPYYGNSDRDALTNAAQRRAKQMRQRMPSGGTVQKQEEETVSASEPVKSTPNNNSSNQSNSSPLSFLSGIMGGMDSDVMLILAILAMLYKDGSSKKLMMALTYLLM